jgi:hypothetical protein
MGKSEYPNEDLNQSLHSYLDSKDPDEIFAALSMIYRISKNFEFVLGAKRKKLFDLASTFFGKLENLLGHFLQETSQVSFEYSSLILQTFWASFYIELPESIVSEQMLDSWIRMFVHFLVLPLTENSVETEPAKVNCKKLASQILHRFFSRFNNPVNLIGTSKLIAEVFMSKWSSVVLGHVVNQVFLIQGCKFPDLIKNCLLKYLSEAIKLKTFSSVIENFTIENQPLIPSLISSVITPVLCKSTEDEELWQENPVEYIRKETDIGRTYYSAATAALDLLENLTSHGYLQVFLNFLSSALTSPSLLTKEALMHEVGHLSSVIHSNENLAPTVEALLVSHVYPELSSTVHFLRARAVWVYGKFASFPLSNKDHQQSVLEKTCTLLIDSEIPVKYEAALTIPKLLKWEIAKVRIRGEISNLLQVYLNLINQIDSEEIIEALEDIVENFDQEIIPFAVELVERLVVTFAHLAGREVADDNGDSAMAAVSTLNTIVRLVQTIQDSKSDVEKVSLSLNPVLLHCLSQKGFEYMEEGLKLLALLLKYAPDGSLVYLYPLLGTVLSSLTGPEPYGIEKTEGIFPVVGNFIKKYPGLVIADLHSVVKFALDMVKGDKHVQLLGFKILMSVIENLRDSVIQLISQLISEVLTVFNTQTSNRVKSAACQFLFVCIWADTSATLSLTLNSGLLGNVVKYSVDQLKLFEDRLPRTRMLVALSLLLPNLLSSQVFSEELVKSTFKAILNLVVLAEEDSEDSLDEENVDSKEFDDKCQELYKKIKENLEDSDDEPPALENDIDQDYDSIFEEMEYKRIVSDAIQKCNKEVVSQLISGLEFDLKVAFQRIFPEIWNLANN